MITLPALSVLFFIVIGQSNAVGMAAFPSNLTYPQEARMYSFGKDYKWHTPVREPLDSTVGVVDSVSANTTTGAGFVLPMVNKILIDQPNNVAVIVPCARTGSSITEWQRDLRLDTLYGSCLNRVIRASEEWNTSTGSYPDKYTIVFWQGETDALAGEVFRTTWKQRAERLRSDMKMDISKYNTSVKFIDAVLNPVAPDSNYRAWNTIRNYQLNLKLTDANTNYFSTGWYGYGGVTYPAGNPHPSNLASYQTIGNWAATSYEALP